MDNLSQDVLSLSPQIDWGHVPLHESSSELLKTKDFSVLHPADDVLEELISKAKFSESFYPSCEDFDQLNDFSSEEEEK